MTSPIRRLALAVMAETLQLSHVFGRSGWQVAHAGGHGQFALAAVGQCFAQRRRLFNLLLLWKLRKLWREGMADLDPRALRLAMCVDERVRVSGAQVNVAVTLPEAAGARPATSLAAALPLSAVRKRDVRLPAAEPGCAWRVHALAPAAVKDFRRVARALHGMANGTRVDLRASVRDSRTPATLRAAFPLRIDLLLDAAEGYVTLVPARTLALVGADT
jgi:hypothetical protein